jgi:succinate dehydrogenase flavin-adding protein (antitoxin of CptAB toxin-antitoxin module)
VSESKPRVLYRVTLFNNTNPRLTKWVVLKETQHSYTVVVRSSKRVFLKSEQGCYFFNELEPAVEFLKNYCRTRLAGAQKQLALMHHLLACSDEQLVDYYSGSDEIAMEMEKLARQMVPRITAALTEPERVRSADCLPL